MEIGTRKMLHFNVTAHPTAEWTLQQFREAIGCEHDYRFVIVDRDDKFSADLRRSVRGDGCSAVEDAAQSTAGECLL